MTVESTDIAKLLYDVYDVPSGICEQIKNMEQCLEVFYDDSYKWPSGERYVDTDLIQAKIEERLQHIQKDLHTFEILKKYIYYSNKSHCFRMKEIRKSTQNFDYEDLKEVIGDAIIPKQ